MLERLFYCFATQTSVFTSLAPSAAHRHSTSAVVVANRHFQIWHRTAVALYRLCVEATVEKSIWNGSTTNAIIWRRRRRRGFHSPMEERLWPKKKQPCTISSLIKVQRDERLALVTTIIVVVAGWKKTGPDPELGWHVFIRVFVERVSTRKKLDPKGVQAIAGTLELVHELFWQSLYVHTVARGNSKFQLELPCGQCIRLQFEFLLS